MSHKMQENGCNPIIKEYRGFKCKITTVVTVAGEEYITLCIARRGEEVLFQVYSNTMGGHSLVKKATDYIDWHFERVAKRRLQLKEKRMKRLARLESFESWMKT